jgi:hypothetical protein
VRVRLCHQTTFRVLPIGEAGYHWEYEGEFSAVSNDAAMVRAILATDPFQGLG